MSKQWIKRKLSDLVVFQRGFDITKAQQQVGPIPIISSSGITSYHNVAKQKGPAIIIGRKGTLGSVHYYENEYWPHDTTLWSKELKGHPRFTYYLLKTMKLEQYDVGNANPTLNRNHIHKLDIRIPSTETQQKIAHILSAYDDLIENNLKRIKLLEEMAQITYEEWFVRMKFPGHENTSVDDETGLPEGWVKDYIGNHYKTASGGTPSRKNNEYYDSGNIPWVKTQELRNNLILDTLEKITPLGLQKSSAKIFPENTTLLAMYGNTIGETGFLTIPASTNQACCAFLVEKSSSYYIHQYLIFNKQQVLNYRMGAAQENISQEIIKKIKIIIPSKEILEDFSSFISPTYELTKSLLKQNQLLKEARDILLPRLMTGLINVDDIDLPTLEPNQETA